MDEIINGETLRLGTAEGNVSRRKVLKMLGVAGTGAVGLSKAIERAYGAKPSVLR